MYFLNSFIIEPKYAEKRDFVRMQMNVPIQITIKDSSEIITGICKNLSGNGLFFATSRKIDIGTQLKISIYSPDNKFNNLNALIQVSRIDEQQSTDNLSAFGAKILLLE